MSIKALFPTWPNSKPNNNIKINIEPALITNIEQEPSSQKFSKTLQSLHHQLKSQYNPNSKESQLMQGMTRALR